MSVQSSFGGPHSFIERQIRRVNRNLLIANGVILGLLAIIALLLRSYLFWFFHGTERMEDADILAAAKASHSGLIAYADIRDHVLIPTGYVEESTRNGNVYSTMPYYFIAVGDKQMLVKATPHSRGDKLVGPLQSLSVRSDQEALEAILAQDPRLRSRVLPIMLNAAAAFTVFGYLFFAMCTPIFALCGYNFARVVVRQGRTNFHPIMRSLARQGDPGELARAIDAEMWARNVVRVGKAIVTKNWLLRPTVFGMIACRLDDIVWAFHSVIAGDNVATFAFRDGRMMSVPLHRNTPELLAEICERVPWVEQGWDREKARKWRTKRPAFLAHVDSRKNNGRHP
jgi:hypothetical protein